jgi:hypothetical protein
VLDWVEAPNEDEVALLLVHVNDCWTTRSALQTQYSHLSGDLVLTWQ